eukprot:scaffold1828_cov272-Chaetoceros_neogracile.AAC.5
MARREEEIRAVERRGWKKSSNPVMSQMNSLIAGEWELLCNFRNCSRCRQDSEGGGPAREAREPPSAAGVGKGAISPPEALPRPRVWGGKYSRDVPTRYGTERSSTTHKTNALFFCRHQSRDLSFYWASGITHHTRNEEDIAIDTTDFKLNSHQYTP